MPKRVYRLRDGVMQGYTGPTHHDEREGAGRVDRDAPGVGEQDAGADAVAEACRTAAGEGGGRPVGEVDTADAVAVILLRYIRGHTLSAEAIGGVVCVLWQAPHHKGRTQCAICGMARRRGCRPGAHSDERKVAVRGDRDAMRSDDLVADR